MSNETRTEGGTMVSSSDARTSLATTATPCRRLVSVILAGGSGTRLWPMSREQFPKQLIGVVGRDSLLQATVSRMKGFTGDFDVAGEPIIVCGEEHRFTTEEQTRESGVTAKIIVEPASR